MITFPSVELAGGKWTFGIETCAALGAARIAGAKNKANILIFPMLKSSHHNSFPGALNNGGGVELVQIKCATIETCSKMD
jgi:hypothetical protein